MSAADFDKMSNDELRHQMEVLGMPKVPITASTRNILIKRLQNHVNGSAGKSTTPAKGRRETMHVVKYSSDDDSDRDAAKEKLKKKMENHKNARRQTIGGASPAPAASRASLAAVPAPAPVPVEKSSRKSMRATPTKTTRESSIPAPTKNFVRTSIIPVTIEDSDEELLEIPARKPVDRRSKSKTPTLAKSDLVTTSYKHVVGTLHEEEGDEDDDENSEPEDDVPLATRYPSRTYEVSNDPKKYSPIKPMSIRISPLRRTTLAGGNFSYEPSPRTDQGSAYSRASYSTSKYSSSGGGGAGTSAGPTDETEDFPYLREFSKRLSTLKAEPLIRRNSPLATSSTTRTSTTSYSSSSRTNNYRPLSVAGKREPRFYDPIVQFLAQLEDKYRLKQKILILLVVLVIIFVCVLIWY